MNKKLNAVVTEIKAKTKLYTSINTQGIFKYVAKPKYNLNTCYSILLLGPTGLSLYTVHMY